MLTSFICECKEFEVGWSDMPGVCACVVCFFTDGSFMMTLIPQKSAMNAGKLDICGARPVG